MTVIVASSALLGSSPASTIGMVTGTGLNVLGQCLGKGLLNTTGGVIGAGGRIGGMLAAAWTGTVGGGIVGGISGLGSAAGSSMANTVLGGPLGGIVLGAEVTSHTQPVVTYDCWKPLIHYDSEEPSQGRVLRDVLSGSAIRKLSVNKWKLLAGTELILPEMLVENVWDEVFKIEYVLLPNSTELAAHAVRND